ncbi:MAG: hypothetical protein RBU30_26710 [Polyangia bacterium]|nr:hypothetical protein [Polyangia bacterium]
MIIVILLLLLAIGLLVYVILSGSSLRQDSGKSDAQQTSPMSSVYKVEGPRSGV